LWGVKTLAKEQAIYLDPTLTEAAFFFCAELHQQEKWRFLSSLLDEAGFEHYIIADKPYVFETKLSISQVRELLGEVGTAPCRVKAIKRRLFPFQKHTLEIVF